MHCLSGTNVISAAEAYTGSHSGDVYSSMSSWTNVDCTGYECGLVDCQYDQTSQCSNSDDAGVRCQPCECAQTYVMSLLHSSVFGRYSDMSNMEPSDWLVATHQH